MTVVIGLTGGIASGKSTVSTMLEEIGIPVIDADKIAKEVVEVGQEAYIKIVATFGEEILLPNGELDRLKLGAIIFNDAEKRKILNNIVHPAVRECMNERKNRYLQAGEEAVVLDIPLLFEGNLTNIVDKVLVVYVDEEVQLDRLMKRNDFTKEEALARIHSQMPLKEKVSRSDEAINNNGSLEETKKTLMVILGKWGIMKKVKK
ncbi:dephospho-CoA kinase [Priestia taiwanensis]|uniref:Dephospho-CoA kinase n=1 Tax=Priestia taiwanensis TaxID=1347902 RepID=A0A917AUK7_9BACI|nr:dephospho-CoA kinase [Priestia taiwanensis]MBM7363479.1 dephospho-CoA kinase [Priestia taiwanensis]GGE76824.1 dephospho-CoA kinase [Priestia taiwanensis]